MKRLIVGIDGTWQSALHQPHPANLTNISRLLTAIDTLDTRKDPPVVQVKHYIAGVGTGEEVATGALHGAFGTGALEKVREAYYFLAQNWNEGDEIYLFGFSRGAYIARLVCTLIDLFGILDPTTNLALFPSLFAALCLNRDVATKQGFENAGRLAALFERVKERRDRQVAAAKGGFLVQRVGLFDTVPLYHYRSLSSSDHPIRIHLSPFGLPDAPLPPTIRNAFHALSVNESRDAYEPLKWEVGSEGLREGQRLEQTWFAGVHTDVGGGYSLHDLADLSLAWLTSRLMPDLSLDSSYLAALSAHPAAPWGEMAPRVRPHHFLDSHPRPLPISPPTPLTGNETLHPSLRHQHPSYLPSSILPLLDEPGNLVWAVMGDWETKIKEEWAIKHAAAPSAAGPASAPPSPTLSSPSSHDFPPAPRAVLGTASPFLPTARQAERDTLAMERQKLVNERKKLAEEVREERAKVRAAGDAPGLRKGR